MKIFYGFSTRYVIVHWFTCFVEFEIEMLVKNMSENPLNYFFSFRKMCCGESYIKISSLSY